jgi:SAM-dependent methyltransferase
MAFKDHFSEASANYAAFRPTYPAALAQWLAGRAPGRSLCWDCGCGTGQFSVVIAEEVARVEATDASAAQVAAARPHPRVRYRTAPAEAVGLPDACADLITVAQAAHWFDLPAFYAEARRVGRPGALLALICYGVLELEPALQPLVLEFRRAIAGDWPPERRLVEEGYRGLAFPPGEIATPDFAIEACWSLPALLGYVSTWSALKSLRARGGEAQLDAFAGRLADAWGLPGRVRPVRFPIALRVGLL